MTIASLESWAPSHRVEIGDPSACATDFGRMETCAPSLVVRPLDVEALCACVRHLGDEGIPFKVRGAGHSNGGQVLFAGGVIVDLRRLHRIASDDPEAERVTIEGGATWLEVFEYLAPRGRRPMVLTDNLTTTIGGTLAVGGFGDTSHLFGLQADHVTAIDLVTPTGELRRLTPSDELFHFVLCGRGQLGIIARATLVTCRRPAVLVARRLRWASLAQFLADAAVVATYHLFEYFRARVRWAPEGMFVDGLAGHFAEAPPADDHVPALLRVIAATEYERDDLLEFYGRDRSAAWTYACPALELVYPLPDGLDAFVRAQPALQAAGVPSHIPIGASLVVTPRSPLPLAPSPASERGLMVALRPQMTTAAAHACLPALRGIAVDAVASGAKLYLMGVEPAPRAFLGRQAGAHLRRWLELKRELDPRGTCNPGLLDELSGEHLYGEVMVLVVT